VCLHLERSRPDVLTVRMSCEHHRIDFEGSFFNALLIAAGATGQALNTSITNKRQGLIRRLRERLAARRGAGNPDGLFYPCRGESVGAGQSV
jgi:hypothetical protein